MRTGALHHVIELQRASTTLNEAGTPATIWTTLATLRAEIVRQATEEFLGDSGARDETAVVFRTRYLDGVTNADRVLFEGRAYNLREVTPIGRRRGLELRAVEVT